MPGTSPRQYVRYGSASLLVLITCVTVTAWALAPPGRDPIGSAADWVDAKVDRLYDWYRTQPVDGAPEWNAAGLQVLNGDAALGPTRMVYYGCGSCHVIPGVANAQGTVGPSLARFADRAYIAGALPNTPANLTNWLINPPLYASQTAMPNVGVSEADAKNIAAYLLQLGHNR